MKILYGILDNSIDVTDICIEKLNQNNIITIPYGDENRASVFTDPLFGIVKQVIIENDGIITEYDIFTQIKINTLNNQVTVTNENDINNKIAQIHSNLKIEYGSILYELPEQKMVVRYLTGKEKVLEIGANIGRNSLVIASILGNENQSNFVSLECDANIANQLTHNRELNNFNFHIESSALSNRQLIQKGWDTKPSETLEEGFTWVKTITLAELKNKYNIEFDTLVLDCEGAFYYILMDMPELLNNINLIIMENDYWEIDKKNYIDDILKQNNFYVDYVESGGWGPCYSNFFEVWKKMC
jgi:FkbM family methyltransferase